MYLSSLKLNIKKHWKPLLIIYFIYIIIVIAIIISIYFVNNNKDILIHKANNDKFISIFTLQFTFLSRLLNYGEYYSELFEFKDTDWNDFINLSGLDTSLDLFYIDELRLHYKIDNINKAEYETYMSNQLSRNISIFQVTLNNTFVNEEYDNYCPLTYLSPNISSILPVYIGSDICHVPTYRNFIELLDNSKDIEINTRRIIRTNQIIFDIGKKISKGYILVSLIIETLVKNISNQLQENYCVKIYNLDLLLYDGMTDKKHSYSYEKTFILFNKSYRIIFYYSNTRDYFYIFYVLLISFILYLVSIYSYIYIYNTRNLLLKLSQFEYSNELLGYINHELRNPLNSVQGLIQLTIQEIKEDMTDEKIEYIKSNLYTAEKGCFMINHIINDILDMTKLQKEKLKLEYSNFKIKELFNDLKKILIHKQTEFPNIDLCFYTEINEIYLDKHRLTQILLNFITNSYKFTENGFIKIEFKYFKTNKIKISVIDSGIGVDENKQDILFKPYEQVNISDSLRHGGMGLGLYICKMLADLMNLDIGFNNNKDKGSEFYIILNNDLNKVEDIL